MKTVNHYFMKEIEHGKGFTLIELMITIAIAAIVATIGIPSFNSTIRSARLTTNINELVTSLNFARSEAVKRNQPVSILQTGGATGVWEGGWNIFTDADGDGVLDAGDGDTLLRVYEAIPAGYTLRSSGISRVTYQPSGISGNSSFVLCDNSDGDNAPQANTSRLLTINVVGRVRMGTDADDDDIPEKEDGTEISSCTVSPFS